MIRYASHVEVRFKSGKIAEALELTNDLIPEIGTIPNIKRFVLLGKGDDKALLLAFYDTAEEQESATPQAQELLGRLAGLLAVPPERKQVEVAVDETY